MARNGRVGCAASPRSARRSRAPDRTPRARFLRGRAPSADSVSTTRKESNTPGISGPSWNARSAAATRSSVAGSRIRSSAGSRALDEPRHEPSLRLDERDDLGADPERRCRLGRGELDRAVDPEQVGVLARDPQHEALAVDLDLEVVVRDAAAEHLEARRSAGPDALDFRREGHARIRSPLGSKSGSSATTPATHSPKISTATSVPTSCSAGRYAYAIDFATV